jgi:hypothetical protein
LQVGVLLGKQTPYPSLARDLVTTCPCLHRLACVMPTAEALPIGWVEG